MMKSLVLATLSLFVAVPSAYAQNDSLPEPPRRGMAVLAGGRTCNTQGDCFTQYGVRLAGLKPGHVSPDVALLLRTGVLMDFSIAHAAPLSGGLYFSPRLGLTIGGFRAFAFNVGVGFVAVLWQTLVVRLDLTYRDLWIGEFGVVRGFGLGSLTLGLGTISGPVRKSGDS